MTTKSQTDTAVRPEQTPETRVGRNGVIAFLVAILAVLVVLFAESFQPGRVLFSNDGPLGPLSADNASVPEVFTGYWADLNWLGGANPSATPNLTWLTLWFAGPIGYSKFFAPLSIFLLGLAAFFLFRQLGFHPAVCIAGGLAAALNSDFFSYAAWGLGSLTLAVAAVFAALAILVTPSRRTWVKAALAGLAVGFSIMEGFDSGAIFSLYIAAFVVFQSLIEKRPAGTAMARGVGRTAIVAIFAAMIAAQTLVTLVGTQIVGIEGTQQDAATRARQWNTATQWSFPKIETLRVIIPGLYGYRMDTADGGNYWGSMGRDAAWDEYFESKGQQAPPQGGLIRHSGSGPYAGILVVLGAIWAVSQSFRRKDPVYGDREVKFIWFWAAAALISLLLAYGRYAPFYQIIYALPYFSAIRIPAKFLHMFHVALVILFAFGLQGIWRRYVVRNLPQQGSLRDQLKHWWRTAPPFDRRWTTAAVLFTGASLLGWLIYNSSRPQLERHLQEVGFSSQMAPQMAAFSAGEVGWFVFFLAVAVGLLVLLQSGALSGGRAKWAGVAVGLFLAVDLGRANTPWIIHYDYETKYASNSVIDMLRQSPHEQRVTGLFFPLDGEAGQVQQVLMQVYQLEWLQHQFQYYDVQSLDIIQMPRAPAETAAFKTALAAKPARLWELTNTRYILGMAGLTEALNQQLDPEKKRFRVHTPFALYQQHQDGPILTQTNATGPYAIIEFTGALPRVKLFDRWQVITNDATALQTLADPAFQPSETVMVASPLSASSEPGSADAAGENSDPGSAAIVDYSPKRVQIKADAKQPSVLMLNDKFDPNWNVYVDGERRELLRCNFIMRGVFLEPGEHVVEFRYEPPVRALYLTLAAMVLGIGLVVLLFVKEP